MNIAVLLDKLTAIELSIGLVSNNALRNMVLDAQDCILTMQKSWVQDLLKTSRRTPDNPPSASPYAA